jgi:ABC-type Mn2+/Zn2+ transport system permease subunit
LSGWLSWFVDPLPQRFMLPATGLLMLGLDWLLFPGEAATGGLATPLTAIVGFAAGSLGTYFLQRRFALNSHPVSLMKAVLAGLFVGVPLPMAGTLVGGWILATSGLANLKNRILKQQLFRK